MSSIVFGIKIYNDYFKRDGRRPSHDIDENL